jgi:hypothetical protein
MHCHRNSTTIVTIVLQSHNEKKKRRADKFEELVATVYEFDHWLDKERESNLGSNYAIQGVSPFAKLEAIAAVHFPQFDQLIRELELQTNECVAWMTKIRFKRMTNTLGDKPLDGYDELAGAYTGARSKLLKALREFAHKEFQ